jgi:hypothetical protein
VVLFVRVESKGGSTVSEGGRAKPLSQCRPIIADAGDYFGIVLPSLLIVGFVSFVVSLDEEPLSEDSRYQRYVAFHAYSVLLLLVSCIPGLQKAYVLAKEKKLRCGFKPFGASLNLFSKLLMGSAYGVGIFESGMGSGQELWLTDVGNVSGNCSSTDTHNVTFAYTMLLGHASALAASGLLLTSAALGRVQFKRFLYASTSVTGLVALIFTAIKADEMGRYQAEDCFLWEKSIGYTLLASQGVILLSNLAAIIKKNSRQCIRDRRHEVAPELDSVDDVEEGRRALGRVASPIRKRAKSLSSVAVFPLSILNGLARGHVSSSPASVAEVSPASPPGLTS